MRKPICLHTTPAMAYVKSLKLWVVVNDEGEPIMYTKLKEEAKSLLECIDYVERNSDLGIPTIFGSSVQPQRLPADAFSPTPKRAARRRPAASINALGGLTER